MKNSAVEALVRVQFSIPSDIIVTVVCLGSVRTPDGMGSEHTEYEFRVEWVDGDIQKTCELYIPHAEVVETNLSLESTPPDQYEIIDVTSGAFTQVALKKDGNIIKRSPMELTGGKKHISNREEFESMAKP